MDDLKKIMKENDGWVPVWTEIFPKENEYVLLSFSNFSCPLVGRYEECNFFVGDDVEPLIKQDIIVNGWMPLPERLED